MRLCVWVGVFLNHNDLKGQWGHYSTNGYPYLQQNLMNLDLRCSRAVLCCYCI